MYKQVISYIFLRNHADTIFYDTDLALFLQIKHTCSYSSSHARYRQEESDLYAQERHPENERAGKEEALCQQSEVAGRCAKAHQ